MSERVFIIGAGKVGRGLAHAFRTAGLQVLGVHARTAREGASTSGSYPKVMGEANVVILAVTDASLNDACHSLAIAARGKSAVLTRGTVVLHTSGSVSPPALDELRRAGSPCGTFHPLAPFSTAERGAKVLRDGWVGIDGDPTACAAARRLAAAIGARTVNIPPNGKAMYHAAAVVASNFPIVLAALASRLLVHAGVEERAAEQVVQRLMAGAVTNLEFGSPQAVLTGPAVRGDAGAIAAHRAVLRYDPELLAVYDALTGAAAALAGTHSAAVDDTNVGRRSEPER
ncbi:MAG TPA: Rossmann-like and DUF2520 domain-containing protein [Gemmatimonadaceae bacterium]